MNPHLSVLRQGVGANSTALDRTCVGRIYTRLEREIKTTFAKEEALRKERGKAVLKLIPLNIDGYMFTAQWDLGVLGHGIKGRVAVDFRGWETDQAKFNGQVDPGD
jgi:hypothetical protein